MSTDSQAIWRSCLDYIQTKVRPECFQTWLASTHAVLAEDGTILIVVPNRFVADWIRSRYGALITEALTATTGQTLDYRLEIQANGNGARTPQYIVDDPVQIGPEDGSAQKTPSTDHQLRELRARAQLSTRFSFDSFVVGESNQLAHAAAWAVAEMPGGTRYNPLCIYGAVGLGKTHLAQAIGNAALENNPDLAVLYVTSERFTNEFIDALAKKTIGEFVARHRSVDVLLIDDVQFFAGKESTQEQFFHTFNTLHQNGKQIVLTADRPPRDIKGLEERLLSRFQWGLAADIRPPDFETRMAILKKKLEGEDIILPCDVLAYIARGAHCNIRQLEGALVRLLAVSSLNGCPVTLDKAEDVLRDSLSPARRPITIAAICQVIQQYFGVPPPILLSKRRTQEVAMARQVAMYLARTLTTLSLKTIGAEFGGRDHSTVIHAINVIRDALKLDQELKLKVDQAISALHSGSAMAQA